MKSIIENIAALIKVKSLATFIVLTVWAVLAIHGSVASDKVHEVTLMVVAFYFGTQLEKSKEADK